MAGRTTWRCWTWRKDRIKDAALQRMGLIPLRFTDHRFNTDQAGMFADLGYFLGL